MIARLVSQIIGDQWRCLAWAALLVWLLLVAATWSIRLATVALVPNLLPVLGVLGVLGWFGGEMNMGAAMIAAVSVGLSIDGSIHYLANYQQKISRGRANEQAAIFAQRGVGLPIVLSTLALVIGFVGLGRSEFEVSEIDRVTHLSSDDGNCMGLGGGRGLSPVGSDEDCGDTCAIKEAAAGPLAD